MTSPPLNSSETTSFASLVATALISMALGVVSTAYIMNGHSPDVERRKPASSRRRRPSSDCSSNSNISDNGDEVVPLEKMQTKLSEAYYMPASRQEDGDDNSRTSSPRRRCSSITKDSDIDDGSILGGGDSSDRAVSCDGNGRRSLETFDTAATSNKPITINSKVVTREESYISETEIKFKGEEEFGESILQSVKNLPDSLELLRRTRAVSALASRLIEARDEAECIEEVSRLLAIMLDLDRISFGMVTGSDHFLLKRVVVKTNMKNGELLSPSSLELEVMDSDFERPLDGTACGVACRTLREHYAPRTKDSPFDTHKALYEVGFKSTLTVPILVNGKKCAGAILIPHLEEDGFPKQTRVLISDIACILGSNLYSKRLRKATEESNKMSRQILNSFVPAKVLEKIECFWDERKQRKSEKSIASSSSHGSNLDEGRSLKLGSNAWYVANADWSEAKVDKKITTKCRTLVRILVL